MQQAIGQGACGLTVTPMHRTCLCFLQACKVAGGDDAFVDSLLPQLLPVFGCPPSLRSAYGCTFRSCPPAPHAAAGTPSGMLQFFAQSIPLTDAAQTVLHFQLLYDTGAAFQSLTAAYGPYRPTGKSSQGGAAGGQAVGSCRRLLGPHLSAVP